MNNEIEKMTKIIYNNYLDSSVCARELFAHGIGDKRQAVKEFADMMVDTLDNYQYDDMTAREIADNLITELYGAENMSGQIVSVRRFIKLLETNLYGDYAMHEITKRELKIFQNIINYAKKRCNINE